MVFSVSHAVLPQAKVLVKDNSFASLPRPSPLLFGPVLISGSIPNFLDLTKDGASSCRNCLFVPVPYPKGIDIARKHVKKTVRTEPASQDPYLRLLVKLYRFLARRTDSQFNAIVLRRLMMSRTNRPPVSLSKLSNLVGENKNEKLIAVIVGTVVDDERLQSVAKVDVCALRFSEAARNRIIAVPPLASTSCLTFRPVDAL